MKIYVGDWNYNSAIAEYTNEEAAEQCADWENNSSLSFIYTVQEVNLKENWYCPNVVLD